MKLVYFHGFASSGASGTAQLLAKLFPSGEVIAPDIPLDPDEALPFLTELVKKEQPDIIIGTSMGGMYAQQMRGVLRICVNPAFQMSSLSKVLHTGTFKWLNGRKNHEKEFKVTHEILQHFRAMERRQFDGITEADKELCFGLFGMDDTTVNPMNACQTFLQHYPHATRFEGGHRLNEKVVRKVLLPLMQDLLGEVFEEARKEPLPDYMRWS